MKNNEVSANSYITGFRNGFGKDKVLYTDFVKVFNSNSRMKTELETKDKQLVDLKNIIKDQDTRNKNVVTLLEEKEESNKSLNTDNSTLKSKIIAKEAQIENLTLKVSELDDAKKTIGFLEEDVATCKSEMEKLNEKITDYENRAWRPKKTKTSFKKKEIEEIFEMWYVANVSLMDICKSYNITYETVEKILSGEVYSRFKIYEQYQNLSKKAKEKETTA